MASETELKEISRLTEVLETYEARNEALEVGSTTLLDAMAKLDKKLVEMRSEISDLRHWINDTL